MFHGHQNEEDSEERKQALAELSHRFIKKIFNDIEKKLNKRKVVTSQLSPIKIKEKIGASHLRLSRKSRSSSKGFERNSILSCPQGPSSSFDNKKLPKTVSVPMELEQALENFKIKETKTFQLLPSFKEHSLSKGMPYRQCHAITYRSKTNYPANGSHKQSFFSNFKDPVPRNHQYVALPRTDPKVIATSKEPPEKEAHQMNEVEEIEAELKLEIYFNNLCQSFLHSLPCSIGLNCDRNHEIPSAELLEEKLLKNSPADCNSVFKFLLKFPSDLRNHFFPAFAKVYARRKQYDLMKQLLKETQKTVKFNGSDFIVYALIQNGWKTADAIHFTHDCKN